MFTSSLVLRKRFNLTMNVKFETVCFRNQNYIQIDTSASKFRTLSDDNSNKNNTNSQPIEDQIGKDWHKGIENYCSNISGTASGDAFPCDAANYERLGDQIMQNMTLFSPDPLLQVSICYLSVSLYRIVRCTGNCSLLIAFSWNWSLSLQRHTKLLLQN